jgi:hypothetical protein
MTSKKVKMSNNLCDVVNSRQMGVVGGESNSIRHRLNSCRSLFWKNLQAHFGCVNALQINKVCLAITVIYISIKIILISYKATVILNFSWCGFSHLHKFRFFSIACKSFLYAKLSSLE